MSATIQHNPGLGERDDDTPPPPPIITIREAIARLAEGQHLTAEEAEAVMGEIMRGDATPAQISAYITALRIKGETVEEVAGSARAMRATAVPVRPKTEHLLDTCGTGGDGSNTFNISTTVAFVAAGAGLAVAKHGNRAMSSRAGSADVLQALGVKLELTPEQVARCIDEVGFGFLFAPALHPAMRHAIGPRREIGIRTIFNILGPLSNPAGAEMQVLGVFAPHLTELMAAVLADLGSRAAYVVHGAGGLDELAIAGPSRISYLQDGEIRTELLDPLELGIARAPAAALLGGTAEENAAITRAVLGGERGPRRDVVLLNAAAALVAGGAAADFREGLALAADTIDSGRALARLDALVELSRSL